MFINADEYFLVDAATKRVRQLRPARPDRSVLASVRSVLFLQYQWLSHPRNFMRSPAPGYSFLPVEYTYTGGSMTHMTATDLFTGDLIMDAGYRLLQHCFPASLHVHVPR